MFEFKVKVLKPNWTKNRINQLEYANQAEFMKMDCLGYVFNVAKDDAKCFLMTDGVVLRKFTASLSPAGNTAFAYIGKLRVEFKKTKAFWKKYTALSEGSAEQVFI